MSDVQWEEPRAKHPPGEFDYFYEALRQRPGDWARYPGAGPSVHTQARRRPGFEAATRHEDDGQIVGWMRYVGGSDE